MKTGMMVASFYAMLRGHGRTLGLVNDDKNHPEYCYEEICKENSDIFFGVVGKPRLRVDFLDWLHRHKIRQDMTYFTRLYGEKT